MKKVGIGILIFSIVVLVIGFLLLILKLFIHSQCMQLTIGEYYQSTICEKDWNDTDWEKVREFFGR